MARLRLRAFSRTLHLWIGLVLFLVLAPIGLTGAWLVYDDPIDAWLHPQRHAVSGPVALTPGAYVDAARQAFGERAHPTQLRLPQGPDGGPVTVQGGALTAWLDPGSGKVLEVGAPRQELRGMVHQLHGNLFMAQAGRKLVGWLGLFMLASCVSGLIIWWPRGLFIKGLAWRRSPLVWSNLHHMMGFWICVPLALLSFTGAAIAFPEAVRLVSGAPAPTQGPRPGDAVLAEPHLTVDAAVAAALTAAGPARVLQVVLPGPGKHPSWRVQLRGEKGAMQVRVDDRTGATEARPAPPSGPGGGDPVMRLMRQVHDGDDTHPLWRAVIAAAGLAPALLGVTGTALWLKRRRPSAG
ncbi:MAG TPA: PepSY-associated TM helix domain-containing protein [Caulobacteraceae bacterium]|jgi:uncharacterized iron-regulated membrane protein